MKIFTSLVCVCQDQIQDVLDAMFERTVDCGDYVIRQGDVRARGPVCHARIRIPPPGVTRVCLRCAVPPLIVPQIFFVFSSPLNPDSAPEMGQDMNAHIGLHGDGVKDVAFAVDDVRGIFADAVARGAEVIREPTEETDEHGTIVIATVKTYGDTVHSFVQRNGYKVGGPRVGGRPG